MTRPQMLLCLHEEAAVAIAHGYAKASGRMMGVVLHSNVGLMHGSMAIFNAWCDRVPMLILGATGPWDAAKRRPWIDWIHTSADQGALVRDYTKWDNQPASVPAAYEALLRAVQIADTAPRGPTYVNLDAALQEAKIGALPRATRRGALQRPGTRCPIQRARSQQAAQLLSAAKNPVILAGRVSRSEAGWKARVALAEKLQARVFTDIKTPAAFPTDHPLHAAPPATFPDDASRKILKEADVVLSLDWVDPAGTLKAAWGDADRLQGHPRLGRRAFASRLEHGLPGLAAFRRVHDVRAGCGGAVPPGSGEASSSAREPEEGTGTA